MAGRTNKSTKVCVWRRRGLAADIRCTLLQGLVCGPSRPSLHLRQRPLWCGYKLMIVTRYA